MIHPQYIIRYFVYVTIENTQPIYLIYFGDLTVTMIEMRQGCLNFLNLYPGLTVIKLLSMTYN